MMTLKCTKLSWTLVSTLLLFSVITLLISSCTKLPATAPPSPTPAHYVYIALVGGRCVRVLVDRSFNPVMPTDYVYFITGFRQPDIVNKVCGCFYLNFIELKDDIILK